MKRLSPLLTGALAVLAAAALFLLAGCAAGDDAAAPTAPRHPTPDARGSAFRVAVDLRRGTAAVSAPTAAGRRAGGPSFSLVAGDGVALGVSNVTSAPLGAGKARVRMDVALTNRFAVTELVTPTTPAPPAGARGILLVPYMLELPNDRVDAGLRASSDWDGDGSAGSGAPHNFFNDFAGCKGVNPDCLRWEAFNQPLAAGATSETRTVGFDVPANAPAFVVYVFVAADLRDDLTAQLSGRITGLRGEGMAGVAVSAGGGSTATDASGAYALRVPLGETQLAVTSPTGCDPVAARTIGVAPGGRAGMDVVISCIGAIAGAVRMPGLAAQSGSVLTGITVRAGSMTTQTAAGGSFTFPGVPAGSEVVEVAAPTGCDPLPPVPVTVAGSATAVADFAFACAGDVSGRLWDVAADAPLAGKTVQFGGLTAVTDAAGAFSFGRVPLGVRSLSVAGLTAGCGLGSLLAGSRTVIVAPGPVSLPRMDVMCPGKLLVRFVDLNGLPVTGLSLFLHGAVSSGIVHTDANGEAFVAAGAGAASASIVGIPPQDCSDPGTASTQVPVNGAATLTLTRRCWSDLQGDVTFSFAGLVSPLRSGTVRLTGAKTYTVTTDAGGTYFFSNVDEGSYTLSAPSLPASCQGTASVTVRRGPTSVANLRVRC